MYFSCYFKETKCQYVDLSQEFKCAEAKCAGFGRIICSNMNGKC